MSEAKHVSAHSGKRQILPVSDFAELNVSVADVRYCTRIS